ncbi:MAG: flagellar biosynthetic protein FliO [Dongiaceae bacterium]
MELDGYLRFILALVLVLGLLGLAAWMLRRSGYAGKLVRSRRLGMIETLALGPRHRLMLIRRDDVEHLLLLGPQGDTVVERNIVQGLAPGADAQPTDDALAGGFREPTIGRPGGGGPDKGRFADVLRDTRTNLRRDNPGRDNPGRDDQS